MADYGMTRAFMFCLDEPDRHPSFSAANDRTLAFAERSGGRLIPFVRLDLNESPIEEATRCLDAGARGIKLHPRAQKFTATDDRRSMWLQGQAKSFETGANVNDRTGAPLIFTVAIPDVDAAGEGIGVRFNKFPPMPSASTGSGHPNDFTFFRLAEMYLIRAEAYNEMGQTANALADLNRIHNLHDPTNPVTAATQATIRDAILKERLLEFAGEGKRRTDLIRAGKFLSWTEASAHGHVNKSAEAYRVLFPIPSPQLGSNPKLVQNPGY